LDRLAARLNDPASEVRLAVIDALTQAAHKTAIPGLENALKDRSALVRHRAAAALESFGWQAATASHQAAYWAALGEYQKAANLGAVAVESLAAALQDSADYQRQAIVGVLSRIGDVRAVKLLKNALQDPDLNTRIRAIEALAQMRETDAVPDLIQALRDNAPRVRAGAAEALSTLGDPRAIDPMLILLKDPQWDVRQAAAAALGKFHDAHAIPKLAMALGDPDPEVRETAIKALREIGDMAAVEFIVPALKDENSGVRHTATATLRALDPEWEKSERARAALPELKAALKHKDYYVRQAATDALAKMGESRVMEPLLAGLVMPSQMRHDTVLETLQYLMRDCDGDLRQAAAECLGRLGDRRAAAALEHALNDPDLWVRYAAAAALKQMNWQPVATATRMKWLAALKIIEDSPMPPLRMAT
jgi:HEAT repeat protein